MPRISADPIVVPQSHRERRVSTGFPIVSANRFTTTASTDRPKGKFGPFTLNLRGFNATIREFDIMDFTIREIADPRRNPDLLLIGCLIVVMTLLGPFGTYDSFDFWPRLGYWAAAIGGVSLAAALIGIYLHAPRRGLTVHPLAISLLSSILATIPGTLIVWQVEVFWRGVGYDSIDLVAIGRGVFVIILVATIIRFSTWRTLLPGQAGHAADRPGAVASETPFFERLPRDLGTNLLSLSMQDHYVECVTARGRTLVLMRFTDALRELQDYPGMRIHRSHWVADGNIVSISRRGSRYFATLSDRRELPVSRTYLDAVREAVRHANDMPEAAE